MKNSTVKDLLKHLGAIALILILIVIGFFYIYLPSKTNHGQSITVPDLQYKHMDELEDVLVKRGLTFEVSDSVYTSKYPPLTILHQYPAPESKVKEGRKIFLTVNRQSVPQVKIPEGILDGKSITHVKAVLQNLDIYTNKIIPRSGPYLNMVLEIRYQDDPLLEGTSIPKGSSVDVVVSDGNGSQMGVMPNFYFMPLDEVDIAIKGMNLNLESIVIDEDVDTTGQVVYVIDQNPLPSEEYQVGEYVRLRIDVELDSTYWKQKIDTLRNVVLDTIPATVNEN